MRSTSASGAIGMMMCEAATEPDWKVIAMRLKEGLTATISHGKFVELMYDTKTGEMESIQSYMADRLEAYPGVKVDRELIGLTSQQRRKILADRRKAKS
jgi:hypothetical protein